MIKSWLAAACNRVPAYAPGVNCLVSQNPEKGGDADEQLHEGPRQENVVRGRVELWAAAAVTIEIVLPLLAMLALVEVAHDADCGGDHVEYGEEENLQVKV